MRSSGSNSGFRRLAKPTAVLSATAAVLALAIAGCGSSASTASNAASAGGSGSSGGSGGGTKGAIQIAGVYSLTGPVSGFGILAEQGAKAAVSYLNQHGGINGHQVSFKVYDDQSRPEVGVSDIQQIAANSSILGISGFNTVLTGAAEAKLANEKQIPAIVLFGDPQAETPAKWIFKSQATYQQHGLALMRFLSGYEGVKSVGVEYQDNGYGNVVADWMQKDAGQFGMTVKLSGVDPTATDFTPVVRNLLSSGVKSLVSINTTSSGAPITAWKSLGGSVPLVLPIGASNPLAIKGAWSAANGLPVLAYFSGDAPLARQKAIVNYFAQNKLPTPQYNDATGWDSVMLLAKAIGAQSSPTRDSVRTALEKTTNYQGAAGIITWTPSNHEGFQDAGFEWLKFNGNGGYTYLTNGLKPTK